MHYIAMELSFENLFDEFLAALTAYLGKWAEFEARYGA